ncbi:MAG: hypothetical protein ABI182_00160 [Candidatus Baltobacteraceae bacterium]
MTAQAEAGLQKVREQTAAAKARLAAGLFELREDIRPPEKPTSPWEEPSFFEAER